VLVKKKLARSFNFTFRHIDDVLSLSNAKFGVFVDRIYPIELDIATYKWMESPVWKN
jgi:hypothetical protein